MKFYMLMLATMLAAALTSCALLMETSEKAAKNAGDAIAEYCKLPKETRVQFRELVNKRAAPHVANIACKGD